MIELLVWSKDRACQLDLLLHSIEANCPHLFSDISVIYTYSEEKFFHGYERLKGLHLNVDFYEEYDFYENTTTIIKDWATRHIALSTDDTVIYKLVDLSAEEITGRPIFSLRYGLNTIVQDCYAGINQPRLDQYTESNNIITWDWSRFHPHMNYGYPFGLDMHIYNRDMLIKLLDGVKFKNTNELETRLFHLKDQAPKLISSLKHSVAVNVPVNNISGVTRYGETYSYTIEELNEPFLAGQRLDLSSLEGIEVVGAHQEIPLRFKDNG